MIHAAIKKAYSERSVAVRLAQTEPSLGRVDVGPTSGMTILTVKPSWLVDVGIPGLSVIDGQVCVDASTSPFSDSEYGYDINIYAVQMWGPDGLYNAYAAVACEPWGEHRPVFVCRGETPMGSQRAVARRIATVAHLRTLMRIDTDQRVLTPSSAELMSAAFSRHGIDISSIRTQSFGTVGEALACWCGFRDTWAAAEIKRAATVALESVLSECACFTGGGLA